MYKIYIDNRFITISSQPDRMQNYCLFHKFHDQKDLSEIISTFLSDENIGCLNIYSYKLDHLWYVFQEEFHFVEAAGGLITDSRRSLLLIKRYNRWDAPKGHFEPGESPEECARREIQEETGVKCGRRISELEPTYHIYRHTRDYYLKKTYWFLFKLEGEAKTSPQLNEGITEAKWLDRESISEIRDLMWLSVRDVIFEIYRKYINHL